ncbi:hypothetical protein [Thioclava sp. F1Mire-8]|uniref:hypothetical protein n=1 Tax=Thioclava sp. F1Mire-8 TaxID=1973006 RepID=UPI0011BD07FD|nr:hypothetical protein [Thioclava sp. F1Mire-8]
MFDTTAVAPQGAAHPSVALPTRGEMFVCGRYTYATQETKALALQLLYKLELIPESLCLDELPKTSRRRKSIDKMVMFASNVLMVISEVEHFCISMSKKAWNLAPRSCGYTAAKKVTDALRRHGFIKRLVKGRPSTRTASIFSAAPWLRRVVAIWLPDLAFGLAQGAHVEVRKGKESWERKRSSKAVIRLQSFPRQQVRQQQDIVAKLNAYLGGYILRDASGKKLDTILTRIFSNDLQHGGRLYGYEFQSLPEKDRLACTIGGQEVCEVDLKASHVAFLAALFRYARQLPQDPYRSIQWVADDPELRRMAKVLVQVCVYADGTTPSSFPQRVADDVPFREKYGLPTSAKVEHYLPAIYEALPFLRGSPRLTMNLQYLEAEAIIDTMLRLAQKRIPAFPVHDSLLVRKADLDEVIVTLQETLADHLGPHAPWLDVSYLDGQVDDLKPLQLTERDPRLTGYRLHNYAERAGLNLVYDYREGT